MQNFYNSFARLFCLASLLVLGTSPIFSQETSDGDDDSAEVDAVVSGKITAVRIYDQITDAPVEAIEPLSEGMILDAALLPTEYYLVVETEADAESVFIQLNNQSRIENVVSYTLPGAGENGNNLTLPIGNNVVTAKSYQFDGGNTQLDEVNFSFSVEGGEEADCGSITTLQLVNSANWEVIMSLEDGAEIDAEQLPASFHIEAVTEGEVESVRFDVNGDTHTEQVVSYDYPNSSGNWNAGAGEYAISAEAYSEDGAQGQLCDAASVTITITGEVPGAWKLPTAPTYIEGAFMFVNEVEDNGGNGPANTTYGRLKSNGDTQIAIPGPYPVEFDGPVTISIPEVISWDGYNHRTGVSQLYEQWNVVFLKDGEVQYATEYTEDLIDNVASDEIIQPLATDVFLPNGTDSIIIVHIEDGEFGLGGLASANSIVPASVVLTYSVDVDCCSDVEMVCPDDIVIGCGNGIEEQITWEVPTATSGCGEELTVVQLEGPAPGSEFETGVTTITYGVEGCEEVLCSFNVVVEECTPSVCEDFVVAFDGLNVILTSSSFTGGTAQLYNALTGEFAFEARVEFERNEARFVFPGISGVYVVQYTEGGNQCSGQITVTSGLE